VASELLETIVTWRTIYESISAPEMSRGHSHEQFHNKWNLGMLKVAGSLGIVDELKNTPVEKHMMKAVEDGKSKDVSRLDDIYVLFGEVEKYIKEKVLS
jgi:hypothetical protein